LEGSNHTHSAPYVLLQTVKGQLDPDVAQSEAMHMAALIQTEVGKLDLPLAHAQQVQLAIERVTANVKHWQRKASIPLLHQKTWATYFSHPAFQLKVWGTQRLAYGAIWDGYEAFVKAVTKTAANIKKFKNHDQFNTALEDKFGTDLYKDCWATEKPEHPVNVGRVVRNALCHTGGRETEQFEKLPDVARDQFYVIEGKLQIWPTNTRTLFNSLKSRVLALATKAVRLPGF
jgi:hypothetical protein